MDKKGDGRGVTGYLPDVHTTSGSSTRGGDEDKTGGLGGFGFPGSGTSARYKGLGQGPSSSRRMRLSKNVLVLPK